MQQERRKRLLARVGKLLRQADGTSFKASDVPNARARAAGFQAGKEFSPSPTQRLAPATPRLKQG
jgi:hypothetical protein